LSGATTAYNEALGRFNGYVLEHGSMMDDTAKKLEAEKEAARRAVSKASSLLRRKAAPAEAVASPGPEPVAASRPRPVAPAGKGALLAGGVVIGTALLGVGAVGWYRRRPRILPCPGCKKRLRVPGRGLKTRCPSCKTTFES
jgi:tRNA(Ile2) C34 agmatinyltransferase TiaS